MVLSLNYRYFLHKIRNNKEEKEEMQGHLILQFYKDCSRSSHQLLFDQLISVEVASQKF